MPSIARDFSEIIMLSGCVLYILGGSGVQVKSHDSDGLLSNLSTEPILWDMYVCYTKTGTMLRYIRPRRELLRTTVIVQSNGSDLLKLRSANYKFVLRRQKT